jgi:hypothetical protein
VRLHLAHSAIVFIRPLAKTDFILTSPPQLQENFSTTTFTRAFLLISATETPPFSPGLSYF